MCPLDLRKDELGFWMGGIGDSRLADDISGKADRSGGPIVDKEWAPKRARLHLLASRRQMEFEHDTPKHRPKDRKILDHYDLNKSVRAEWTDRKKKNDIPAIVGQSPSSALGNNAHVTAIYHQLSHPRTGLHVRYVAQQGRSVVGSSGTLHSPIRSSGFDAIGNSGEQRQACFTKFLQDSTTQENAEENNPCSSGSRTPHGYKPREVELAESW
ncbi:hypothetical protein BDZ89DRAFT_1037905 [Hymenopellis radicata]|nr:hypothetical protein BDZ89DRAFT_1037905 [Hymenopellis radicata]